MTTTQQPDPFGAAPYQATALPGPRARFWIRFGANFLDTLVLLVPYIVLAIAFDPGSANTLILLAAAAYFALLEGGRSGQTLGKRACGIRVVDARVGAPIGPGRGLIRWLGRWVSFSVFLLGYLWMLWDPEKQTWHDKMARSVVVPIKAYPIS
jgi:uncharacterized RDD family membrane protein YckC